MHISRRGEMCGILFYDTTGMSQEDVHKVRDVHVPKLRHRGPDATNVSTHGPFLLGFHRLAIIGTEGDRGMQPFFDDKSGSRLICSGEIYNSRQLARELGIFTKELRSDVDAILRMERTQSPQAFVPRLDGDFAFVLTRADGSFAAARDHVGVRPLFYGVDGDQRVVALASEAKALLGAPGVANVFVFPPSTTYSSKTGAFTPYVPLPCFTPGVDKQPKLDSMLPTTGARTPAASRDREDVKQLLTRAVQKRVMHSERPIAVLCSGGIDSAIVTCLATSFGRKIRVFTMQYDSGLSEDSMYAQMLCDKLGVPLTTVRFGAEDVRASIDEVIAATETYDPNTVRASIPMYLLAKHIAQDTDCKVVLSGEGADELFAGYSYFARAPSPEALKRETGRLLRQLHMFDLLRADRCFAAWGLEVRVPFLDQDLVRHVSSMDGALVQHGGCRAEKQLLRDAFADLKSLVETRILDRPKERFSDGCGFSYVPQLLNHVSRDAKTLPKKTAAERERYGEAFDAAYPGGNRHWIVERTMPEWIAKDGGNDSLLIG